jgi:hypothetical protein
MVGSRLHLTALCALALVCVAVFAGCGKSSNKPGETVREGLSTPLDGLRYTVFLTRQLNLANEEDKGYAPGRKEAPPGKGLYGIFLEACNKGDKQAFATNRFFIEDAQGERFQPQVLAQNNPFAYHGGPVPAKNCEPVCDSWMMIGALASFAAASAAFAELEPMTFTAGSAQSTSLQ